MIEIVFTHDRDREMVERTHRPRPFPVFWIVEEKDRLFDTVPLGVVVIRTSFRRGGNLRGEKFIRGYIELLKSLPAGLVLKRDSDTIIENPHDFIPVGKIAKGVAYSTDDARILGCAYCLDTTCVIPFMEKFATKGWFSGDDIWISKALLGHVEILPTTLGIFVGDDSNPDAVFLNLVNHRQVPIRNQSRDSSSSA